MMNEERTNEEIIESIGNHIEDMQKHLYEIVTELKRRLNNASIPGWKRIEYENMLKEFRGYLQNAGIEI